MMKLTQRIASIKPSPTLAITAKANALRAEAVTLSALAQENPISTHLRILNRRLSRPWRGDFTKYTAVAGIDELKDAIIGKFQRDNGLSYRRPEIAVSCGAKHSLYNLAQVLFEEGDEVIIPAPYWVSYADIVLLTGAKPVIVETSELNDFKMQPEQLKTAISSKTRAIILNSPSNPTGCVYNKTEMEGLGCYH